MHTKMKAKDIIFIAALSVLPLVQFAIMWVGVNINSLILPFQKYNIALRRFDFLDFDNALYWIKQFLNDMQTDYAMRVTLKNSLFLYFWTMVVLFPLHLLVAYSVWKKTLFSKFFTVMLYLPNIISGMVFCIVFKYFIEYGMPILTNNPQMPSLITNPNTGFMTLTIYMSWFSFGSGLVIYIGAMCRIPDSVIEYGQLEGITAIREFWNVVMPMIFPTISVFIVTSFVGIFANQFVLVEFFGTGAPTKLQTFGYYFFIMVIGENSGFAQYPYAAAASLVFTVILFPIVFFVKWALEKFGPNPEY